MTYFTAPLETDSDALLEQVFVDLQARWPNWRPNEGNLEVVVAAAFANQIAELRDVASDVPDDILRVIGERLHQTPAIDAAAATADTTWTAIDAAGYTIPAGAEIAVALSGSESVAFTVTADTTIAVGSTSATVPVEALEQGTAGNDLSGDATLLNPLFDWVDTITVDGATTGGVDAETNEEYLARLVARLQLQAPRPILARDFAVLALDTPGVGRATAIDNYIPGTNEVQSVTINAAGGTWTWSHGGQTTAALAWNITAAAFQTAIEALSNFLPGDVIVTGGPGATAALVVEFTGDYADTNVAQATTNAGSLTGGAGTAAVATVTAGVAAGDTAERAVTVIVTDDDGEPLSSTIRGDVDDALQTYREVNFLVSVRSPTYVKIQVDVDVVALPGFDPGAVGVAVQEAVAGYLSPARWGKGAGGDADHPTPWENRDTVRYLEVASIVNDAIGADYITSLQIGREGGTLGTADVTLPGTGPLPRAGTISVSVT